MRLSGRGSEVLGHREGQAKGDSGLGLLVAVCLLGSQVTRVFWLVFGSDNYVVGTCACIKCCPGNFVEEGGGHLVVEGLWVSRSFIRIFIGVQGSQNFVDRFQLRKEDPMSFRSFRF